MDQYIFPIIFVVCALSVLGLCIKGHREHRVPNLCTVILLVGFAIAAGYQGFVAEQDAWLGPVWLHLVNLVAGMAVAFGLMATGWLGAGSGKAWAGFALWSPGPWFIPVSFGLLLAYTVSLHLGYKIRGQRMPTYSNYGIAISVISVGVLGYFWRQPVQELAAGLGL